MSTKIYDGLISTRKNPLVAARLIRACLEPMFYAKFVAAVEKAEANRGTEFREVFGYGFGLSEAWKEPIPGGTGMLAPLSNSQYDLPELIWDRMAEANATEQMTFTELDFMYEVSMIPNGNGMTERPLILVFSEAAGDEYRKALKDAGVVADYGYWNNTDRPDDVTKEAWKTREKAWQARKPDGHEWHAPNEIDLRIGNPSKINTVYRLISERAQGKVA